MVDQVRLSPPAELAIPIGEAMFTQRAIRKFKPDPIGSEQLKLILDAASRAPSGGNFQPARFLVIRDRARILAFGELYREAWWAKRREGPGWTRIEDIPKSEKSFLAAAQLADEMGQAPVVVLVFAAVRGDLGHSVLPAVQNLLLSARAVGIGSTLTTLHEDVMQRVFEMFNVPDSAQFYCCIPMGYPRGRFGTTLRRPTIRDDLLGRLDDSSTLALDISPSLDRHGLRRYGDRRALSRCSEASRSDPKPLASRDRPFRAHLGGRIGR